MQTLTIYYDGLCPLCMAEITLLRSRNAAGLVNFVNFRDNAFDEDEHQISCSRAMATMHGRLEDGQMLTGVRVFEEAYRRVGLNFLAGLLSITILRPILDKVYVWFAAHRHAISKMVGRPMLAFAVWRYGERNQPVRSPHATKASPSAE